MGGEPERYSPKHRPLETVAARKLRPKAPLFVRMKPSLQRQWLRPPINHYCILVNGRYVALAAGDARWLNLPIRMSRNFARRFGR